MINPIKLKSCLIGLVGFSKPLDKDLPEISSGLLSSESGIYFDKEHSLLTAANIISCIEDGGTITMPDEYDEAIDYSRGELATSGTDIYSSLLNGNQGNPLTDETKWRNQGSYLNRYLTQKIDDAIVKLAASVFQYKNLNANAKTVLGDLTIFQGSGNIRNTIEKKGRFVGFKIGLKEAGLSAILSRIGMQFTDVNSDFKIYLYHSSQINPIQIFTVSTTKPFSFEWKDITRYILSYTGDDINDGGTFSIGYYEDDLTGDAIERKVPIYQWSGCGTCDAINSNLFRKRTAYIGIQPFYVNSADIEPDRTIWNEEKEMIIDNQNWGLNLQLSVMCDVSDIFCRNKYALAKPLATQIAVCILEDMAFGARDNQRFEKVSQLAAYALGTPRDPGKISQELKEAVKALSFNMSGINKRCLPCDLDNGSITFGTIY